MRQAHLFSLTAMSLLVAAASPLAFALSPEPAAQPPATTIPTAADIHNVFNPAAPTQPLQHPPLPASGDIVSQPGDWKAANAAVAEFPRGHGDVLKWEKAQSHAPRAEPAHTHEHAHGQQHDHRHGDQP